MTKNLFIRGHKNLRFLLKTGSSNIKFNHYMFRLMGIRNKLIILILDILSPFIYLFNIIFSCVYFTIRLLLSFVNYQDVRDDKQLDFDEIYLFFFNYFTDRCKSARLYDKSKYYIIMPSIDTKFVNLPGKSIIDYRKYVEKCDSLFIYYRCFSTLLSYIIWDHSLCFIHKAWEYYEMEVALKRIAKSSTMVFCNQSDKWALLFDSIPSDSKILLQHGVVSTWGKTPYRLKNIDIFYSMTRDTWKDAYEVILECNPRLVFMEPTIELFDTHAEGFKVLIVADIVQLDTEKEILKLLSSNKNVIVYLKKHPALVNDQCYRDLQKEYCFNYITEKQFPKVDFVVSYYSTLAYEYLSYNIPVYIYQDKDDFNKDIMMLELDNAMEKKSLMQKNKD